MKPRFRNPMQTAKARKSAAQHYAKLFGPRPAPAPVKEPKRGKPD